MHLVYCICSQFFDIIISILLLLLLLLLVLVVLLYLFIVSADIIIVTIPHSFSNSFARFCSVAHLLETPLWKTPKLLIQPNYCYLSNFVTFLAYSTFSKLTLLLVVIVENKDFFLNHFSPVLPFYTSYKT